MTTLNEENKDTERNRQKIRKGRREKRKGNKEE